MKSTVEKLSPLERKLNIEVPAVIVASSFDIAFRNLQKQAHIKGFRPGKAPIATIKAAYGARVAQDVVQELVQKHYAKALQEHKLNPINYPEFEFDAPTEDKEFSFSANFEVRPEVALNKYEGLEVIREKFLVEEKQIDEVINNIRTARAALVDVLEDRAALVGDTALVDFEGFVDGKPLENGTGTDHQLELGAKQFIEGFEEGVVGMKVGGQTTLKLKFPDPYHAAELAGKPVEFKVTLKALKKKSLPEVNDEFVAAVMGDTSNTAKHTVEGLRKTIQEDIEQSEKKRIETDFKNRILKKIVEANPVDVPPSLLREQKEALVDDVRKKMTEQGMNEKEFAEYAQKWDKDFDSSAAEMIQSGFIIDTIAEKHNLKWNEEDLQEKYLEYAKQTGLEVSKIREWYAKPEQTSRLTYMITEEKVIQFLTKVSKITELEKSDIKNSGN